MLEYYLLIMIISFYVITGIFIFSSFHKHLLITLLALEYIILNIYLLLVLRVKWEFINSFFLLIFLIFIVVEGRVGLSVLVRIIRRHGSDIIKSLRVVW
jgi:NADH:ubiquinone oxidoreductase subunit K